MSTPSNQIKAIRLDLEKLYYIIVQFNFILAYKQTE